MFTKHWMFLVVALVGTACVAVGDDQPIVVPPASTAAPVPGGPPVIPDSALQPPRTSSKVSKKAAASSAKKISAKPAAANAHTSKATADLKSPAAEVGPAVVRQDHVNVRGRPAINSEVVTRLKKGEKVTVLEEVTVAKAGTDEPNKWSKIALPSTVHTWVNSMFVDANHTIKARKLNMRSGPGENYSVVGTLEKGATVTEVERKGDWIKIEPATPAYAYVASHLLAKDTSAAPALVSTPPSTPPSFTPAPAPAPAPIPVFTPTPPTPIVTPTPTAPPIVVAAPVAVNPVPTPAPQPVFQPTPPPPTVTTVKPVAPTPTPTPAPLDLKPVYTDPIPPAPAPTTGASTNTPPEEEVYVKRVVTREGIVKRSVSIQAPTYFVLQSLDDKRVMNYLHSTSTNIALKDFKGHRILVTGEELLDERWPLVPVIEVETLEAVR